MKLGQTIIKIRHENKLTQEEFAKMFNVTRQTVSNWENEKNYPDLLTLIKLSENFGYSLDSMLKENQEMTETMNQNIKQGELNASLGGISAILLLVIAIEMMVLNYGSKFSWILLIFVVFINAGNISSARKQFKKESKRMKLLLLMLFSVFVLASFGIIYYIR